VRTHTTGPTQHASRSDRGAAMVEFALVLPVLLLLLFGFIDFGVFWYNDLELSHAARDAARRASVATSAGEYSAATAIVKNARLVPTENTTNTSPPVTVSTTADGVTIVTAVGSGTYKFFSPFLPLTLKLGATAVMRHE